MTLHTVSNSLGPAARGASLLIVRFLILLLAAPLCAQTMTEDDLFAELDLGRPALEAVAAVVHGADRVAARHALAEYYRHRAKPVYFIAPGAKANPNPSHPP